MKSAAAAAASDAATGRFDGLETCQSRANGSGLTEVLLWVVLVPIGALKVESWNPVGYLSVGRRQHMCDWTGSHVVTRIQGCWMYRRNGRHKHRIEWVPTSLC